MLLLSKGGEVLIKQCAANSHTVETVIVGSGYGGAVAARRLAAHGSQVYVLERGDEYVSGEFPNDISQIGKHVRADILTPDGVNPVGNEQALFDVRLGAGVGAIVGNGLGGGSLINAAIGLQADPRVFQQASWPAGLRDEDMSPYYALASQELELQTPGEQASGVALKYDPAQTKKYQRLKEIFLKAKHHRAKADAHVEVTFEPLPMGIQLEAQPPQHLGKRAVCNGCGDCVTGCNYHAKLSLTATYLPKAVQHGAHIYTGLTVLRVEKNPHYHPDDEFSATPACDAAPGVVPIQSCPWVVVFVRTMERELYNKIKHSDQPPGHAQHVRDDNQWEYHLYAQRVVLSAGTFGSTEILLRSRQHGLCVSKAALGMGFSGNGDDIAFAFGVKEAVNGIGHGACKDPATIPPLASVGPTASGVIHFRDKQDVTRSTVMEDGAIPGLMRRLFGELTHTLGTVIQLSSWRFKQQPGEDPLAVSPTHNQHTLGLLGMGHDSAKGVLVLDAMSDRLALAWPDAKNEQSPRLHKLRQAIVRKVGAVFIQNPATGILPDAIANTLNGPAQETRLVTVHPLGGCRMADSVYTGVVNHWGAVFIDDGQSVDQTHEGLFVLDGSIIPSALGVNPMLTITALAERACEKILLSINEGYKPCAQPSTLIKPAQYPQPLHLPEVQAGGALQTRLSEVLRCHTPHLSAALVKVLEREYGVVDPSPSAALFVEMAVVDWDTLLLSRQHAVDVIPTAQGEQRFTRSRLVLDIRPWAGRGKEALEGTTVEFEITAGQVRLFELKPQGIFPRLEVMLRVLLTYLLNRWIPDLLKPWNTQYMVAVIRRVVASARRCDWSRKKAWCTSQLSQLKTRLVNAQWGEERLLKKNNALVKAWNACKLVWHASEVRTFHYDLQVALCGQTFQLTGKKVINAGATWPELWRVYTHLCHWQLPAMQRKSVWEQLTQLEVKLIDTAAEATVLHGHFGMDFPEMLRRFAPQLGKTQDTLNALINFARYPLFLGRAMLKTRLLDFRLPDYKDQFDAQALPFNDPASIAKPAGYRQLHHIPKAYEYPTLMLADGQASPCPEVIPFDVKFSDLSVQPDTELGLIRYCQPLGVQQNNLRYCEESRVFKAKSIILLNGLALTTHAFVASELKDKNLAAMLYAAGWDVWLLEYRASPLLDASAKYSSIDDIAKYDIPEAVNQVIARVSQALATQSPAVTRDNVQIYCFSHCIGSVSLMMSLLSGQLRHTSGQSKLAGILISQFQPYPVGSKTTQVRLRLATFIRDALNISTLQFTAGQAKSSGFYQFIDRILASFNYGEGNTFDNELCPHEKENLITHQPDSTSCKRMTGVFGRSMVHDNLLSETHDKLDVYFGRANVGVFLQGAKCVEYEQLVNMDGQNVYVNDANIIRYVDMPVMVLHGEKNVLFDQESYDLTTKNFERLFGKEPQARGRHVYFLAKGYGHFDCTIGKDAHKSIFRRTVNFFEDAHAAGVSASSQRYALIDHTPYVYHPRLPRTGPMIGWVREEDGEVKCRVWFEVDNDRQGLVERTVGLTRLSYGSHSRCQIWTVYQQAIRTRPDIHCESGKHHQIYTVYFCVADVSIPREALTSSHLTIECLSLHKMMSSPFGMGRRQPPKPAFHLALDQREHLINLTRFHRHVFASISPILEVSDPSDRQYVDKGYFDESQTIFSRMTRRANAARPNTLVRRELQLKDLRRCGVTLQRGQWQTHHAGLSFVAAGCRHLGLTEFEAERADHALHAIAETAYDQRPKFMLMLGDQVYVDARAGVLDKSTLIERLIPRYRQAFGSAGFQAVAGKLPLYMVMDDHEVSDNWSREHTAISRQDEVLSKNAKSAYFVYQRCFGPPRPQQGSGSDYTFTQNGIAFFVLNTRTNKERISATNQAGMPDRRLLSESQWQSLEAWLSTQAQDQPKFIVTGSVVAPGLIAHNTDPAPRHADNWQMSAHDRGKLFDLIHRYQLNHLVLLSSDYHCAAVSTIHIGEHLTACAIVAPALHAPMRFANTLADEVLKTEAFCTGNGVKVTLSAEAWNGEGWLAVDVNLPARQLTLNFNLKDFHQADHQQITRQYMF